MANQPFRPVMFSRMRFKPEKGSLVVQSWNRVQVFRARPPQAWVKTGDAPGWHHNRGDEELLRLGSAIRRVRRYHRAQRRAIAQGTPGSRPFHLESECLARFVELVEPQYRGQLYTLRSRAWHMYSMLFRCPGAVELSRTNQGLAYALANHWVFTGKRPQQAMRVIRRLLRRPRRQIAAYLGFPEREVSVRLLGKIHGRDLDLSRLLWLRMAVGKPKMARALSHLPWLKAGVLEALGDEQSAELCSAKLLLQLAAMSEGRGVWAGQQVAGVLACARALDEPLPRLVGVDQTRRLFDAALGSLTDHRPPRDRPLGPAPVPGIAGKIEPLDSTLEVYAEGIEQENCLATARFRLDCARGRQYIYRVLAPERCTVSLRRARSAAGWVLDDFKAAHNRPPSKGATDTVRAWLASASIPFWDVRHEALEPPDLFDVPFDDPSIPF